MIGIACLSSPKTETPAAILPKEKDGLGFGFVYYDLSGNESHGEEPRAPSVGLISERQEE